VLSKSFMQLGLKFPSIIDEVLERVGAWHSWGIVIKKFCEVPTSLYTPFCIWHRWYMTLLRTELYLVLLQHWTQLLPSDKVLQGSDYRLLSHQSDAILR
jgi:hypothetical protein